MTSSEINGGRNGTGAGFCQSCFYFPVVVIILPLLHSPLRCTIYHAAHYHIVAFSKTYKPDCHISECGVGVPLLASCWAYTSTLKWKLCVLPKRRLTSGRLLAVPSRELQTQLKRDGLVTHWLVIYPADYLNKPRYCQHDTNTISGGVWVDVARRSVKSNYYLIESAEEKPQTQKFFISSDHHG